MRNWQAYVRKRLRLSKLKGLREERTVEELAGQLEDFYLEAVQSGASEESADAWARSKIPDWEILSLESEKAEKANVQPDTALWIDSTEIDGSSTGRNILQHLKHWRPVLTKPWIISEEPSRCSWRPV